MKSHKDSRQKRQKLTVVSSQTSLKNIKQLEELSFDTIFNLPQNIDNEDDKSLKEENKDEGSRENVLE